jgi:hypothetical protein
MKDRLFPPSPCGIPDYPIFVIVLLFGSSNWHTGDQLRVIVLYKKLLGHRQIIRSGYTRIDFLAKVIGQVVVVHRGRLVLVSVSNMYPGLVVRRLIIIFQRGWQSISSACVARKANSCKSLAAISVLVQ